MSVKTKNYHTLTHKKMTNQILRFLKNMRLEHMHKMARIFLSMDQIKGTAHLDLFNNPKLLKSLISIAQSFLDSFDQALSSNSDSESQLVKCV